MTPPDVARALAILAEGRESHVKWRDHLQWHADNPAAPCAHCPGTKTGDAAQAGRWDAAHEQQWVDNYDHVIDVVRCMASVLRVLP